VSGFKAENARAFNIGNKEPRTPVLFMDQDNRSREHPCYQLGGSDLVLSAPCWAVLYLGPGYGVVAARSGVVERVARGARRVARTLGAVCARCGRGVCAVWARSA